MNVVIAIIIFSLFNILYKPTFTIAMFLVIGIIIYDAKKYGVGYCFDRIKINNNLTKIILWFYVCIIMASLLSGHIQGIKISLKYLYWTLPFWMIVYVGRERSVWKGVYWGVAISCFWLCGWGLLEHLKDPTVRIKGFFGNTNSYAIMLELILPFSVMLFFRMQEKLWKCLYALIFLLIGYNLYFTQSRGAIGSVIIAFFLLLILSAKFFRKEHISKEIVAGMISLFLIMFFIGINSRLLVKDEYDNERTLLAKSTYSMWIDHKILGVGLGNWDRFYKEKYISSEARERDLNIAHNVHLQILSETGIIGGIGFWGMNLGLFLFLLKRFIKNKKNALLYAMLWALLAFNIHGFVDVGFLFKYGNKLFWGLLGITYLSLENGYNIYEKG